MLLWFGVIGLLGLRGIITAPPILAAVNPLHAVAYLVNAGPGIGFAVLGAAFLAVTGAEAMYADMGHFGRLPIRCGWFAVVLPALMLNYFGQGALLLSDPACTPESVLPARSRMGSLSGCRVGDARDHNCLAGDDLGCILPNPTVDAAGLSSADAGAPHRQP